MAKSQLTNRSGGPIDNAVIEDFSNDVAGSVILPADPHYEDARKIWNASIAKYPGMIVRCSGVADVVDAVKFARANDLVVAVRGGGHNVAGRALCDDGIVIDLSAMKGVFVDAGNRTARVQGGRSPRDKAVDTATIGTIMNTRWCSKA